MTLQDCFVLILVKSFLQDFLVFQLRQITEARIVEGIGGGFL